MKILLIIFSTLLSISAFCQKELNYYINIETHSIMKMKIEIFRSTDIIRVFYNKLDSIDSKSSESDSKRQKLMKKYSSAKSKSKKEKILNKLIALNNKYEIYKTDSLVLCISENIPYKDLIDSIYKTDEEILLRDMRNGLFVTLDGTSFKIVIKENNVIIKHLNVHAPRRDSHTLLNRLICSTLDLYRTQNMNSFLDKKHTNGY